MTRKTLALILALCLSMNLFAGCGKKATDPDDNPGSAGERKIKDTVTVCLNSEPAGVDPQQTYQTNAFAIQFQIYETLFTMKDGQPQPRLATSWEYLDDCTLRVHLRDDVYFHNGEKMSAEDVRYTVERLTSVANSASQYYFLDAEKTAVVDENTVDIVTTEPVGALFTYLSMSRSGIVCEKAVKELGDEKANRNPCGTGAFEFVEWRNGDQVILKRNDNYWGDKPAYTNLIFKFVTEGASRAIEVETGNADIAYNPDTSDVLRYMDGDKVSVHTIPSWGGFSLYLNGSGTDEVTADIRVRQAMVHALDIEALCQVVYGPLATVPTGVVPASYSDQEPLELLGYDPDKAVALLKEAGYEAGEAEITIYSNNSTESQAIGEICQNMWTQVGFKVNLIQQDFSSMITEVRAYKGSGVFMNWSWGADNIGLFINDFDPAYETNAAYAFDPRLGELKNKANNCLDAAERTELYHQVQGILYYEDLGQIMLADKMLAFITTPNVTGFEGDPTGAPYLGNIIVYED